MENDLKDKTLEELEKLRDIVISEYIGEWNKPQEYYNQISKIDKEIAKRK